MKNNGRSIRRKEDQKVKRVKKQGQQLTLCTRVCIGVYAQAARAIEAFTAFAAYMSKLVRTLAKIRISLRGVAQTISRSGTVHLEVLFAS